MQEEPKGPGTGGFIIRVSCNDLLQAGMQSCPEPPPDELWWRGKCEGSRSHGAEEVNAVQAVQCTSHGCFVRDSVGCSGWCGDQCSCGAGGTGGRGAAFTAAVAAAVVGCGVGVAGVSIWFCGGAGRLLLCGGVVLRAGGHWWCRWLWLSPPVGERPLGLPTVLPKKNGGEGFPALWLGCIPQCQSGGSTPTVGELVLLGARNARLLRVCQGCWPLRVARVQQFGR